VTSTTGNSVWPIDVGTRTTGTPIGVGGSPLFVTFAPDGRTAYTSDTDASQLSVLSFVTAPALAATGPDLQLTLPIGMLALLTGVLLVAATRRRRIRHP
jgi:DNA-binding beta-propeller fold protein YncE